MYKGYYFKFIKGNSYWELPNSYILHDGLNMTPHIIQDGDDYRDAKGVLHRDVLENESAKFIVKFCPMNDSELDAFMAKLNSFIVNEKTRDVKMEYFDKWDRKYKEALFYIPDPSYQSRGDTSSGTIWDLELHFIKY